MTGTYEFRLTSKDFIFDIKLRRNITLIRGDGATYKTLLWNMLSVAGVAGSGVHLHSSSADVIALTDRDFKVDQLSRYKGTNSILVFDEISSCIQTNAFREAVESTGCYFILMTRKCCSNFGVSTKEIYNLAYDDTLDLSKRTVYLKQLYPDTTFGTFDHQQTVITEDSNAGKQFFNTVYGENSVISSHGKSNVATLLSRIPNSIIIVDGAAFGFELEDCVPLIKKHNCYLIALESFEYCILKSGIFTLPAGLDIDNPAVDSTKYLTWERYYTALLCEISADTLLAYNKLNLNKAYKVSANIRKILAVYKLPDRLNGLEKNSHIFSR